MKQYIILTCIVLIWFLIGLLAGLFIKKKKPDGSIIIEMSEDGEREKVRFVLELDLDEIKERRDLLLKVENALSQNSQLL